RATDATVLGDLCCTDAVDDDASRVGGVPDLELLLEVEWLVAERAALETDVGPLAVIKPLDVVAWADVDVALAKVVGQVGRDGLRLGDLLGLQAVALEHVLEVHVATDIELVRAVQNDAAIFEELGHDAVGDSCTDLGLDVVADDRDAGVLELLCPHGVGGDEDRQGVDERNVGVDGALRVVLVSDLGADWHVGHEHVDLGVLEGLDDVHWLGLGLLDGEAVVLAQTVVGDSALDSDAGGRHVGDINGVVLGGVDGIGQVKADLRGIHVESSDELDVVDVVLPELDVHQAGDGGVRVRILVVLDSLNQRAGAVSHANDCDAHGSHVGFSLVVVLQAAGYDGKLGGVEVRRRGVGCTRRRGCRRAGRTFGLDQLGEPPDLPFGGLQTVTLQFGGIEVEPLTTLGSCGPEGVQTFLQPAAAALENA